MPIWSWEPYSNAYGEQGLHRLLADNPEYPQQFSALGIRIGVNYVVYAMTH